MDEGFYYVGFVFFVFLGRLVVILEGILDIPDWIFIKFDCIILMLGGVLVRFCRGL